MVGDYNVEPLRDQVRDNVVSALVTLHGLVGLDPSTLRLHKEDPRTTHDCPGKNVEKVDMIQRVVDGLATHHAGEHVLDAGTHSPESSNDLNKEAWLRPVTGTWLHDTSYDLRPTIAS
jgi:hypothetical protein